jgi:serine protease AprX
LADGQTATMAGLGASKAGRIRGTAPGANFVVSRMTDDQGKFFGGPMDRVLNNPYTQHRVRVSNHSYGPKKMPTTQPGYGMPNEDVDNYIFSHSELLVCWSAGNLGRTINPAQQIYGKSGSKNVLTVGNSCSPRKIVGGAYFPTAPSETDIFEIYEGSSRGPTVNGRMKPDVVAPGVAVLSTMTRALTTPKTANGVSTDPNYCFKTGTSMASPLVAGCAAVLREVLQRNGVASPSAALLKALLINGAVEMFAASSPPILVPNGLEGFGRVNMAGTLKSIPSSPTGGFVDAYAQTNFKVEQGKSQQVVVVDIPEEGQIVSGGDTIGMTLKVTLVWLDRGGALLVNALGLAATHQNGVRRHGNKGNANMSASPQNYDNLDNVQQIVWRNVKTGKVFVTVECVRALGVGEQVAYAVAWSLE